MPNLGIDASNLSRGGGVTHIIELLKATDSIDQPFKRVFIYGSSALLSCIPDYSWLVKSNHEWLNSGLLKRTGFLLFHFRKLLIKHKVDVLFAPGGLYLGSFRPYVTMCRNMLVFEEEEAIRYGFSKTYIRLRFLRILQSKTFNGAEKVIFLSEYAKNYVLNLKHIKVDKTAIIHHGVSSRFVNAPRPTRSIEAYDVENTFKLVYVSILDVYKHQDILIEAIQMLKNKYPVELILVGGEYPPYGSKIRKQLNSAEYSFVKLTGAIDYHYMADIYSKADLLAFASSCENMPNILMEMMSSGVAVACASRGPMREFLGQAGEYFDPEDKGSIAKAIEKLILDPDLRYKYAQLAQKKASEYSWERCANQTFQLINKTI